MKQAETNKYDIQNKQQQQSAASFVRSAKERKQAHAALWVADNSPTLNHSWEATFQWLLYCMQS